MVIFYNSFPNFDDFLCLVPVFHWDSTLIEFTWEHWNNGVWGLKYAIWMFQTLIIQLLYTYFHSMAPLNFSTHLLFIVRAGHSCFECDKIHCHWSSYFTCILNSLLSSMTICYCFFIWIELNHNLEQLLFVADHWSTSRALCFKTLLHVKSSVSINFPLHYVFSCYTFHLFPSWNIGEQLLGLRVHWCSHVWQKTSTSF